MHGHTLDHRTEAARDEMLIRFVACEVRARKNIGHIDGYSQCFACIQQS